MYLDQTIVIHKNKLGCEGLIPYSRWL